MWKQIIGTVGTRYLIAAFNLALLFVNAKVLGLQGIGTIGLLVACINIAVVFNSLFSSNTLVYFMSKYQVRSIFPIAYGWVFIGAGAACVIMHISGMIPAGGYLKHVYLLAILNSLVAANSRFLLGKDRVKEFNITMFIQGGLLFFLLLFLYYIVQKQDISAYIWGLYITNGIAWIVSLLIFLPYLLKQNIETDKSAIPFKDLFKEMSIYGMWGSLDNLAETFTYRLNYFLVEHFAGLSSVGLLDAGTKIAESIWYISRSVGLIEYKQIANTIDPGLRKKVTLNFLKLTCITTCLVMALMLMIPEWMYTRYLFSPEFAGIRMIIILLSPGIIALGCNTIFGYYFTGTGNIRYSAFTSLIGLFILLITGYIFIPLYGVNGSAMTGSIAFCCMLLFSFFIFRQQTDTSLSEFLLTKEDFQKIKKLIKLNSK